MSHLDTCGNPPAGTEQPQVFRGRLMSQASSAPLGDEQVKKASHKQKPSGRSNFKNALGNVSTSLKGFAWKSYIAVRYRSSKRHLISPQLNRSDFRLRIAPWSCCPVG